MADRQTIRMMARGAYDIQKLRIEAGNRLVANFRSKLGIDPGEAPDETPKALETLRRRFEKITEGIVVGTVTRRHKFEYDGVISDFTDLSLVDDWVMLMKQEKRQFRNIQSALEDIPIWTEFMKDVKGCGPAMAAVIISEIDITKATYPSSLWKLAGLDVAEDGRGRSRRKEHLIDVEYTNKDGNKATKKSITFNPWLKTKLVGVLGSSFLRSKNGRYKEFYYNYKHRIENHVDHKEKTKLHRHNMAMRYMIKRFLIDLHVAWRKAEGLPVTDPYEVAKLGIIHGEAK